MGVGGRAGWGPPAARHSPRPPPATRPTRLRASLELSAPDGEPPVLPAAAPRDAKCAGRAMRAAPEQPPDPSSFTKCCRPHRAQRGPPAPRPTRAASRSPPTPRPRPQTPPSPAADPTHRAPTSPVPGPRRLWGPDLGRWGWGERRPREAGAGTQRGQAREACWVPRQLRTWGTRGGPHPPRAPGGGAVAVLWRGDGGRRPGLGLGDTDPVLQSLGRSRLQTSSQAATRGPPAATWAVACMGMSSAQTGRGEGRRPRAWPRRAVHLAVTLGGRRWGGRQDRHPQPVLGTDGEAQGRTPSSPAPQGPLLIPVDGLPAGLFHHASSSPGSGYRTPEEGGDSSPASLASHSRAGDQLGDRTNAG